MAHFYGTIEGERGQASRLGSKVSGLTVKAASWQGAATVYLYEQDGVDMARLYLHQHHGKGIYRLLYDGPVSGAELPLRCTAYSNDGNACSLCGAEGTR